MHISLAVLRTIFFVFVVGFAARALPLYWQVPKTFDEQYARCSSSLGILQQAVWLAIGWILVEVIAGWLLLRHRRQAPRPAPSEAPSDAGR